MKKLGVGIIGYGWAATAHIEAINNSGLAEVRSICSSRELDATEISEKHGLAVRTYSDIKEFLLDETIDVVSITSHPWKHREQAELVALAGKHIILEKPMSLSLSDCQSLSKIVQDSGVGFCLCFECRFSSQFQATKSVIDQGLLGDIHYGEVDYYHGIGPWYGQYSWNIQKKGGGSSLLSAGCHALDALLYCMGGEVDSVSSYSTKSGNEVFSKYEYDTTSVTILKFVDGRVGKTSSVIDCIQPYYFHTHLVGSQGSLLDNKIHTEKIKGLNKNGWGQLNFGLVDSGDVADHPYQNQFTTFFQKIIEGKPMVETGLKQALNTHEVIFAADLSAREGRPISMSELSIKN